LLTGNWGVFAIKPSGVPYNELVPEKMVIVDLDGKKVSGDLRPSSDTLTHAVLYKHWPARQEASFIPIQPMPLPGRKASAISRYTELRMPIILLLIFPARRR
jgi:hypothetical protein